MLQIIYSYVIDNTPSAHLSVIGLYYVNVPKKTAGSKSFTITSFVAVVPPEKITRKASDAAESLQ